jgi:hypothetical protein
VAFLKIQLFWDVTLCLSASSSRRFDIFVHYDPSKRRRTTLPVTQRHMYLQCDSRSRPVALQMNMAVQEMVPCGTILVLTALI